MDHTLKPLAAFWRLRRILRIEKDLVDKKVSEEIDKIDRRAWGRKKNKDSAPPLVNLYEALEYKFSYFESFQTRIIPPFSPKKLGAAELAAPGIADG